MNAHNASQCLDALSDHLAEPAPLNLHPVDHAAVCSWLAASFKVVRDEFEASDRRFPCTLFLFDPDTGAGRELKRVHVSHALVRPDVPPSTLDMTRTTVREMVAAPEDRPVYCCMPHSFEQTTCEFPRFIVAMVVRDIVVEFVRWRYNAKSDDVPRRLLAAIKRTIPSAPSGGGPGGGPGGGLAVMALAYPMRSHSLIRVVDSMSREQTAIDEQCAECGAVKQGGSAFGRCQGCKTVAYCSKGCQRRAWKRGRAPGGVSPAATRYHNNSACSECWHVQRIRGGTRGSTLG